MREPARATRRAGERDLGLRRMRRATAVAIVFSGALAAGVADLAAKSLPGRSATRARVATPKQTRSQSKPRQTAPKLVPAGQPAPAAPSAPANPPAPTSAPPVVSSGG